MSHFPPASRDDDPGAFAPGLVLDGRYRVDRRLGEGGMGTVWVGHQLTLDREVAIKSLRVLDPRSRARLKREALALAAVHHPAIVQVFDYGETRELFPYLVMELVRGETLEARIARDGPMRAPEAVSLLLPVLEGLSVAHAAGIIHRDIKPANVALTIASGRTVAKLLDFGIARTGAQEKVTMAGTLIGTPAYMAPEQILGGDADERTDVWGMATLLYELVAGEPPFDAEELMILMRRVLDDPPPFPRFARGVDGALWAILTSALRKAPKERTGSASALRTELARWLDAHGGPVVPSEPTRTPRLSERSVLAPTLTGELPSPGIPTDPPAPSLDALIRNKLR